MANNLLIILFRRTLTKKYSISGTISGSADNFRNASIGNKIKTRTVPYNVTLNSGPLTLNLRFRFRSIHFEDRTKLFSQIDQ